jgi:hypothetical protein
VARPDLRAGDQALEPDRDAPDGPRLEARAREAAIDAAPREAASEGAPREAAVDQAAAKDAAKDAPATDSSPPDASVDSSACPGTGSAVIGAAGGVLFSADCKARLLVPAGALTAPTSMTMVKMTTPQGGVTASYDIGPTGLVFTAPATLFLPYQSGALLGATESKLTIGSVAAGEWLPLGSGKVDQTAKEISATLGHLSSYGGIPGDATGPVAKVVVLGPVGGAGLGENGGQSPVAGVPVNASYIPLVGRSVSLQVDKPQLASLDSLGILTTGTLGFPPVPASVAVMASVEGVLGVLPLSVMPKPVSTVVASGSYSVQGRTGSPIGLVQLSHVQNPTTTLSIDVTGSFGALPPLPAGSFYTLKLEKAGYLPTYHTFWSLLADSSTNSRVYPLLDTTDVAALSCGTAPDAAKGHVLIASAPPLGAPTGWEYSTSSAGAVVRYLSSGTTPDCQAQGSVGAGAAFLLNVAPGYHWVAGKLGTLVVGMIIHVPSSGSVTLVTFS